ncbi:MAG: Lrp/AsnC family transcriptional regulator [Roseitalea porphyridii]|jgi:Lrp/AsnC family transcriptional regulator of ectoine degradation|uniref:Lrp/AsnC family transcriptional regulator n=1 Tax=Roseitalea porphyridii TaxID=1852022 RepID=UPI0032EAE0BC
MATIKLDRRDVQILAILSREGRISKAALAERVALSATPCWERLKRLEQAGLITGYRAEFALKKIAPHVEVFVLAELDNHRAEAFQTFERAIGRHEEIVGCWALGGGFDYLLHVVAPDIDAYQRLIDGLLAQGIGLARYFTYIVTKPVKTGAPPPFAALLGETTDQKD